MDEKKITKVSLVTVIFIFIIILLISLGIVYYIGFAKNNSIINNNQNVNTETPIEQTIFNEFAVAKSENPDINYIIAKDENNNWNEIIEKSQDVIICGKYNNKLYFADEEALCYIDLTKKPYTETKWLTYKEYQAYDNEVMGKLSISKAKMIEDMIYFQYDIFEGGSGNTDGILKVSVTDTSIDNAVQVISKVDLGKWEIDAENKFLYYVEFENSSVGTLYRFNLVNDEKTKIFDKVKSFDVTSNKILYLLYNQTTTPNASSYYPATHDLYIYDINTKENNFIAATSSINSGSLWAFAEYINNDVYYKSGDIIKKYNNGKNEIIYSYSSKDGGESIHGQSGFYGFYFIDNTIIKLILQNADAKYLVDGKVVTEPTGISTITVKMKNDSTKDFTIDNIKSNISR